LASMESALAWFESLPADLRKERERDLKPDVAGLDQLRQFRESLRSAFRADHTGAQTADGLASFTSNVALRWTPTGLEAVSQDVGWRRIQAEVDIELLLAQAGGRLRRLKTCAYELCGFP